MATLDLKQISESFSSVSVLHDINLAIADKEFVEFVGPSGCSKPTLLRIIAGLEEATSGKIVIEGRNHPVDRGISMVFQSYALYPHLTVFENIAFPLRVQKMPNVGLKKRVGRKTEILKMTVKLGLKPGQLSRGQRQCVAIGRSIVRNQVEAMTMADQIVELNGGHVEKFGTPMELYHHPATKFVAGFNGQPNMNLIPSLVKAVAAGGLIVELAGRNVMTVPMDAQVETVGDRDEVGIRPKKVALGGALDVSVRVLERLGSVSIIYGAIGGDVWFCASLPGNASIVEGGRVRLSVNAADCHFFNAAGKVLRRREAPALVA